MAHCYRSPLRARRLGLSLVLVSLTALGCKTVQVDTVTSFSKGVQDTRKQAHVALVDANNLSRDASIRHVLASTRPTLVESDFVVAVAPDAIQEWDNAFSGLETYASSLQNLLSADKSKNFSDAALALGKELKEGQAQTALPAGVASAFTQIGEIVIQAAQQRAALSAMQNADPHVRQALTAMAGAIGEDPRGKSPEVVSHLHSGLLGTVYTNWESAMRPSREMYLNAGSPDEKRKAIDDFLGVVDRRNAQMDALISLRQSLLSLADAHSAAARGSVQNADAIIAFISQQLDETKSLFQKFSEIEKKKDQKPKENK